MAAPALATPTLSETSGLATAPVLPRLLIADDHHLLLDALGVMMKSEFNVQAVDSQAAFINAIDTFEPEIAILDVNMPGGDGYVTAKQVLGMRPNLPIVFLSMYSEPVYVDRAAQVGARAYFSKRTSASDLVDGLRAVLGGESFLAAPSTGDNEDAKPELTARQVEVLRLIAMGSSAKDIANRLNISVRTAEFHRAAIMQRLGLHSTAQMTRYAIANSLA